jgi:basic membrane lipoprotein Med (substrate-binding protein (PBP1-ABC) superfamily)
MTTSRFLIAGAVAALLQTGVAAAQTQPPPEQEGAPTQPTHPTQPKSDASFKSLDKDGDGRISQQEAEGDAKVKQQFTMYDKNGNGFIDKDEVMNSENSEPHPKNQ